MFQGRFDFRRNLALPRAEGAAGRKRIKKKEMAMITNSVTGWRRQTSQENIGSTTRLSNSKWREVAGLSAPAASTPRRSAIDRHVAAEVEVQLL